MKPFDKIGLTTATVGILVCLAGLSGAFDEPAPPEPVPNVQPAPVDPAPDVTPEPKQPDCPGPNCPQPKPKPQPKPRPHRPWGPHGSQSVGLAGRDRLKTGGPVFEGHEVQVDLPSDILKHNIASKGLGCCVFRSCNYAGLAQNISELIDLPERMKADGVEGGGWPEKLDRILAQYAPGVKYIQVQNGDWSLVKLALKTGRLPCITYGSAHMVNIACLENGVGCFRDNNFTAADELRWGDEKTVMEQAGGNKFWAVIFLKPRMPAPPKNASRAALGAELCRQFVAPPVDGKSYKWSDHYPTREWTLWVDGVQKGNFSIEQDSYTEHLGPGQWGRSWRRPPVPLPNDARELQEHGIVSGVRVERSPSLRHGEERYTLCGQSVTRAEAEAALVDDSALPSLTIIGPENERKRVLTDLASAEYADLRAKCVVQDYESTNWAISTERYGFVTSGHPTIYLQAPDGTELYRNVDGQYHGKTTLEALRKKHPDYQPNVTPTPNTPAAPSAPGAGLPVGAVLLVMAALGAGLGALESPKKEEE